MKDKSPLVHQAFPCFQSMSKSLLAVGAFGSAMAMGAEFVVDTNSDDAAAGFTLREAVAAAEQNGEADVITFDSSLVGSEIDLGDNVLTISSELSIIGPTEGEITIVSLFNGSFAGDVLFHALPGANVTLSNLTLANVLQAVLNEGEVELSNCLIQDCEDVAVLNRMGGRFESSNCIFQNNRQAVVNENGVMIISASLLTGSFQAITNENEGIMNLVSSTLEDNLVESSSSVSGSNVQGSVAPFSPGIVNEGTMSIGNSTFSNNLLSAAFSAQLSGEGGSVVGSATARGGAIFNASTGSLDIVNSTFHGNAAFSSATATGPNGFSADLVETSQGGAIYNEGDLLLASSTLSGNSSIGNSSNGGAGGGIFNDGMLVLQNSIVANNVVGSGVRDVSVGSNSQFFVQGINLFSTPNTGGASDLFVENPVDIFASLETVTTPGGQTIQAGALADNGGPVQTVLIREGGAAHEMGEGVINDAFDFDGDSDVSEPIPIDARGEPRIQGLIDIGAVELSTEILGGGSFEGDDDGDGIVNGVEIALGTNPNVPDLNNPRNLTTPVVNSEGVATLSFGRNLEAPAGTEWVLSRSLSLQEAFEPVFVFDGSVVTFEGAGITSQVSAESFEVSDAERTRAFYRFEARQ